MTERELRVVDDLVGAAVDVFLEVQPRTLALSGGSTPKAVYERLAGIEYGWQEVEVFFGDERCVAADHPDSNFRMANEALLSKVPARVYPMVGCDATGYTGELQRVFGEEIPSFDLAFMGLGDDGHTASLFPGHEAVDVTDQWVVNVQEAGQPPFVPRMTLTLPVFDSAKLALFLVSGRSKREPLQRLKNGEDIPAARVAARRVIVLADREAAG